MTTTRSRSTKRAIAETAEDVQPFPPTPPENVRDVVPFESAADAVVVDANDIAGKAGVPHIDKEQLVGQPFVAMSVEVLPDRAVASDTGEISDLVIFAGQAVDLDASGKIKRLGYLFTCTAGSDISVMGSQMREDWEAMGDHPKPVLYRTGARKLQAAKGPYYTLRPAPESETRINLFDR